MDILEKQLKKFLSDIESPFSINEVFGYLTGFAASNQPVDTYFPALETFFSNKQELNKKMSDYKIVVDNIMLIKQTVGNESLFFPFSVQESVQERLIALGEWSNSFLLSINYLIQHKLLKNTLDYQEIIHDLTEISKVGQNYAINDNEETNEYYIEISSYVVSAVNHIYITSLEDTTADD
ncbi:MAG: UPF0149 family protein [Gammaproteobacteria bacterium]|jgi:uncharacterized protein YgfB (UPF0149 family)|nr:UPF0149 family protein [Gammaproteobacteria bacterium]MBT4462215.1 UPF0149 family protein [Gammaproteobacteria bacterium]MBT4654461.1 UPF0149 family protein [Gammaproteobacteria bacterium]MBT5116873.1 UPF0149 family protein [Gammaproteobacteria bacterium]MBT5761959.1 UPF0149 family protein [Gammaproteobacteria bacterium]